MRARLRDSAAPHRIFRVSKEVAADAGLIGVKRVLDSTPLYDAVATQDTVTLIRGAIRGLLRVCDDALEAEIRRFLRRDDDYSRAGKPTCDWDDPEVGPANDADGDMLAELVPEFMGEEPPAGDEAEGEDLPGDNGASAVEATPAPTVYGDSAYGAGTALALLARIGVDPMVKVQAPHAPGGRFAKDRFLIDLDAGVVTCPNAVTVPIRPLNDGGGEATFGKACP